MSLFSFSQRFWSCTPHLSKTGGVKGNKQRQEILTEQPVLSLAAALRTDQKEGTYTAGPHRTQHPESAIAFDF